MMVNYTSLPCCTYWASILSFWASPSLLSRLSLHTTSKTRMKNIIKLNWEELMTFLTAKCPSSGYLSLSLLHVWKTPVCHPPIIIYASDIKKCAKQTNSFANDAFSQYPYCIDEAENVEMVVACSLTNQIKLFALLKKLLLKKITLDFMIHKKRQYFVTST